MLCTNCLVTVSRADTCGVGHYAPMGASLCTQCSLGTADTDLQAGKT